jgi:hypothetical protein
MPDTHCAGAHGEARGSNASFAKGYGIGSQKFLVD